MKFPTIEERNTWLSAQRDMKMARSPHAYVRGNTVKFYTWLHSQLGRAMPDGPPIWICGDCHTGNLGPIGDIYGDVHLGIRDFDQTVVGNPAHDLVRLGLSLAMAARGSLLPGVMTSRMLEQMMSGYEQGLEEKRDNDLAGKPSQVKWSMQKAVKRSWKHLARERIVNLSPTIPLGKKFWPLSPEEQQAIHQLFEDTALYAIAGPNACKKNAQFTVHDAAYWVKGCSSLGLKRYAVLISFIYQKKHEYRLIDIKEAVKAAGPRSPHAKVVRDNALRVVEGARHLSPALGERMVARRFLGSGVFIRELMPQDLKLEIDHLNIDEAAGVAQYLAYVIGKAHARQMDDATRDQWRHDLTLDRTRQFAAPNWLWDSVVALIARHETGYLEHCRQFTRKDK